jgi:pimeloyl-ACP methyl ester carboxylesterase
VPTVNVNGCDLFYADDDFVEPWLPHETVFMQHWFWGDHRQFRTWVPSFARDYRVVRMDRRGSGRSGAPPYGYEYTVEGLAADFVGFLDALGLERVHYIGESMGGVLGAAFAALYPERLRSLVLIATPCFFPPAIHENWRRDLDPKYPRNLTALGAWSYAWSTYLRNRRPDATPEQELAMIDRYESMARMPTHILAALLRMATRPDFDLTPLLPRIQAPTLLMSPDSSHVTPFAQQELMRDRIPNCRQVVFEGGAHSIFFDQPERCAAEALAFIDNREFPCR